jgi:hypothetical protein
MIELEDRWILPLRGDVVTRIEAGEETVFVLDSGVRIIVGEHAYFTDGPFRSQSTVRTELGRHDQSVLEKSVGARVLSAVGFKDGAFRLVLSSGWHLNVSRSQPLIRAAVVSGETAETAETVLWTRVMPSPI